MNDLKYKDKDWLKAEYLNKEKSTVDIAEECKVGSSTIRRWLKKFSIARRGLSKAISLGHDEGEKYKDKGWLIRQYWGLGKSTTDIAREADVDVKTVLFFMDKLDVPKRSKSESISLSRNKNGAKYKNYKCLYDKYILKDMTAREISDKCNVDRRTIERWINKFEFKTNGQFIVDGEKMCSNCGKWLPIDMFYNQSSTSTGLSSQCKRCTYEREKEKRQNNPRYRLNRSISSGIRRSLKDGKKGKHWEDLVNYSLDDLTKHLESQFKDGMTWENYGFYGWHIDHIKPKSAFDFLTFNDEEFQECWGINNLQPLWREDNLKKGDKYNG